jgi:hypothetical protein
MNLGDEKDKINKINQLYDNLTYFDNYGTSVILFIILTIIVFITHSYFMILTQMQPIKDDWVNQKCNPKVMPFAGFINKPDNISFNDFTIKNFNYCMQNILKGISGNALEPVSYITNSITQITYYVKETINDMRAMTNKVRIFFAAIIEEIMGRLLNVMVPLQQIIIKFKDFTLKLQATMTAGLFTTLGVFLSLKSLLGVIVKFIVN